MSAYRPFPEDPYERLVADIEKIRSDIRQLQMPTGTQIFEATKKLEQALDDIGSYVDAYLATGFTTGSMTASGSITVGGNATVTGTVTGTGGLTSTDVYNRLVTGSGSYRTVYVNTLGQLGQTVSSRQFKQDITDASIDPADVLAMRLVNYRYKAAVENLGDDAPLEVGVIAEEVDELGLSWLIDYDVDDQGNATPFGFKYERLALALFAVVQEQERRIAALEGR